MKENPWLQNAERRTSVNVGFEWEFSYAKDFDLNDVNIDRKGNNAHSAVNEVRTCDDCAG